MPAQGKVDWDSTDAWKKLLTAVLATGVKIDIRQVAMHFGTTYDTLENRLRTIKKDAVALREEVATSGGGEVQPTRTKSIPSTPKKPKTPKKALDNVANGRIAKNTPSKKSPSKKGAVKQEVLDSAVTDSFDKQNDDMSASFSGENMTFAAPDFNASFESGGMDFEENYFF